MELKVKIKIPQAYANEYALKELIKKIEKLEMEHRCYCTLLEVEIEG